MKTILTLIFGLLPNYLLCLAADWIESKEFHILAPVHVFKILLTPIQGLQWLQFTAFAFLLISTSICLILAHLIITIKWKR